MLGNTRAVPSPWSSDVVFIPPPPLPKEKFFKIRPETTNKNKFFCPKYIQRPRKKKKKKEFWLIIAPQENPLGPPRYCIKKTKKRNENIVENKKLRVLFKKKRKKKTPSTLAQRPRKFGSLQMYVVMGGKEESNKKKKTKFNHFLYNADYFSLKWRFLLAKNTVCLRSERLLCVSNQNILYVYMRRRLRGGAEGRRQWAHPPKYVTRKKRKNNTHEKKKSPQKETPHSKV